MNARGWDVTISEAFCNSVEQYYAERLGRLPSSNTPLEELEALRCLIDKTQEVRNGSFDLSKLARVLITPDGSTVLLYVLEIGPWRAYYDLDFNAQSAVCLCAIHRNADPRWILEAASKQSWGLW